MGGAAGDTTRRRLSTERAVLAIAGLVAGSGGLYVVIWTVLGFVLR